MKKTKKEKPTNSFIPTIISKTYKFTEEEINMKIQEIEKKCKTTNIVSKEGAKKILNHNKNNEKKYNVKTNK